MLEATADDGSSVGSSPPTTLFVANFAPNTGYAWDFIEGLYARLADRLAERGVRSLVAYPSLESYPRPLEGSAAVPIELPVDLRKRGSVQRLAETVRRENIRMLYLTDKATWSIGFRALRRAGIGWIVAHDHTSGAGSVPRAPKRLVKRLRNMIPGVLPDALVTVSRFVERRQLEVGLIPADRVSTVYNGVPLPEIEAGGTRTHDEFGIDPARPIIACACRAHPVKGVAHLLRAFDRVMETPPCDPPPFLLYLGDGPQLAELRELRDRLSGREHIHLAGFHPDADDVLRSSALFVVPSLWQDAFPLSVMQPMARAKPVIASRVGGIPEMIDDGVSGLLVPPGDEAALSLAMNRLLLDPEERARMGERARERVARDFRPDHQIEKLFQILCTGLEAL